MFRSDEQRQPPPSRADPKRAWLDAIMSKSRQSDAAPFASTPSAPPPPAFASRPSPHLVTHARWQQQPLPLEQSQLQRRHPSATMYQEQLEMDDALLAETMSLAFKRMVGEQTCCFIAKGICHICGTNERHLIPVVNFCPDFHVSHSLCREHLRSFYHVRMEDIFAGKNRPTVSKRSLKCSVCSRSCPCSTCLLEKQHEISKYKRWLAGEHEYGLGSEGRAAGIEHPPPPPPLRAPVPTRQPRADFGGSSAGSRPGYLTTDEFPDERGLQRLQQQQYPRLPNEAPPPQGYGAPWRAEFARGDDLELLTSLQAGAKPPSYPFRGAKRAAKDTPTLSVQSPIPPPIPAVGEPVESPSAAHVLNCAESEKSLVRLLTTLNQDAPTQELSTVAEPKDSRSHPPPSSKSSSLRRQPTSEDNRSASRNNELEPTENSGYYVDTSVAEADGSMSTSPSRNSKRKRVATAHADSETSSESSATHSIGRRLSSSKRGEEFEDDDGVDADSDEDSEIDTNLDYCEVCLAAGDLVCCDVCPRSFHLACLKLNESDLPEGDWQCAECKKPSFFVRYLALVHMKQSIYGKCVETIRCLKTHPFSKQFLSPVKNIDHYRNIVKHPMDLTTIETKLKSDKYTKAPGGQQGDKSIDIETFANDVRLVWANCKLFNDDGSGITRAADELAVGFESIYEHLQQYIATTPKQPAKTASKPPSRGSAQSSSGSVSPSPSSKPGEAARENEQANEGDEASRTMAKATSTSPSKTSESGNQSAAGATDSGAAPPREEGGLSEPSEASGDPISSSSGDADANVETSDGVALSSSS